jgi:hypothetical protein
MIFKHGRKRAFNAPVHGIMKSVRYGVMAAIKRERRLDWIDPLR